MIKEKNTSNLFFLFVSLHLFMWTLAPSISNINLPLDTIEAIAWGSSLDWGFTKHPPLSALFVEIFYQIFGNQDWVYYLLSQIFVIFSFFVVWKFSEEFLKNKLFSLISVLLLEGIFYYNFTSPEFNVNVCQLPFWALTIYYAWQSFKYNTNKNWLFFGFFSALGFLSKYLFIYLLIGISIFFLFQSVKKKKFNIKYLIPLFIFFVVISPHIYWLINNNFSTLVYAINRTGVEDLSVLKHIFSPLLFLAKQLGILIPFFIMTILLIKKLKFKINLNDKKLLFLTCVNIFPIIAIFLTSLIFGVKIRTMWMTPFYLFFGIFIIYLLKSQIDLTKIKKFIFSFLFFFLLSPAIYLYISISDDTKRTDYPGKEIAYLVQSKWNKNFSNEISLIVGDEWFGGNLSYHLLPRPKWVNSIDNNLQNIKIDGGVIYIGNPKILKQICPGVYGTIKPTGICMIGSK